MIPTPGKPAAAERCCGDQVGAAPSAADAEGGRRAWVVTVASGMATSGCCLLQLGLNLLPAFSSSGCFGMNTHLKRLRPIFAAGTVAWFAHWGWRDFGPTRHPQRGQSSEEGRLRQRANLRRFVLTAFFSLLISLSPEIIAWVSARRGATAALQAVEKVTINVLDMGCEACSEAVGRALRGLPGSVGGMANFKQGTADLFLSSQAAGGAVGAAQIKAALQAVGYGFGGIVSVAKMNK